MSENNSKNSRREFIKKVGYAAPAVLTIAAAPAFAKNGSCFTGQDDHGNNGIGQEKHGSFDGPPPGLEDKPNQDFNDNSFSDSGHSDNGHHDNGHSDSGQSDNNHSDSGQSDNGHADSGQSDSRHSDNGHSDNGHGDDGHSNNGRRS